MPSVDSSLTPTISATIISLLPVIIGGIIAIAGGIVTALMNHWLKRRSDRKQRRKEKLEELATLVCEVEVWLQSYLNEALRATEGLMEPMPASPIHRIEMICIIYFPELKNVMHEFVGSASDYKIWTLETNRETREAVQAIKQGVKIKAPGNEHMERYREVNKQFVVRRNEFLQCAGRLLQRLD